MTTVCRRPRKELPGLAAGGTVVAGAEGDLGGRWAAEAA